MVFFHQLAQIIFILGGRQLKKQLAYLFLQRHPGKKLLQLIYSIVWRLLRRRRLTWRRLHAACLRAVYLRAACLAVAYMGSTRGKHNPCCRAAKRQHGRSQCPCFLFALPLPFPARHRPAAPFLFFGLWCSPLCT